MYQPQYQGGPYWCNSQNVVENNTFYANGAAEIENGVSGNGITLSNNVFRASGDPIWLGSFVDYISQCTSGNLGDGAGSISATTTFMGEPTRPVDSTTAVAHSMSTRSLRMHQPQLEPSPGSATRTRTS